MKSPLIAVTMFFLCFPAGAGDSIEIEGDPSLLKVLREAQDRNLAKLKAGSLTAHVEESAADFRRSADLEYTCDADDSLWNYTYHSVSKGKPETQVNMTVIEEPTRRLIYRPTTNSASIGTRMRSLPDLLAMNPKQVWFCYERDLRIPWKDIFREDFAIAQVKKLNVSQVGDEVVVDRSYKDGGRFTATCDLTVDGLVTKYRSMAARFGPGLAPPLHKGSFKWKQEDDVFRLAEYSYSSGKSDDDLSYNYKLEVTKWSSEPKFTAEQISVDKFVLPPGTQVDEFGNTRVVPGKPGS
jgi:hypothetical protein